jgi:G:T-mismatch repair DNA endonuclease (very short patch repair protein)
MADVHDKKTRSYNMSQIKARTQSLKCPVRKYFYSMILINVT